MASLKSAAAVAVDQLVPATKLNLMLLAAPVKNWST